MYLNLKKSFLLSVYIGIYIFEYSNNFLRIIIATTKT